MVVRTVVILVEEVTDRDLVEVDTDLPSGADIAVATGGTCEPFVVAEHREWVTGSGLRRPSGRRVS